MSKHASRPSYLAPEFERAVFLASHFGFLPVEAPRVNDADLHMTEDCRGYIDEDAPTQKSHDAAEKAAFLRTYLEKEWDHSPLPFACAYKKHEAKKIPEYALHILGLPTAAAEALLLRASLSILEDLGHKHLVVEINSMGDKDSVSSYERELQQFIKKHPDSVPPEEKKRLKSDIFNILSLDLAPESLEHLPLSIASLSSPSRAHFKDTLEYLEALEVEFRLAHTLFGNPRYASHNVFSIRDTDDQSVVARGGRYSRLSKRMGFKKELPAAAMTIVGRAEDASRLYKDLPKPKFHLIQLGPSARLKCVPLIEVLRREKIPVYHALGRDKITAQMSSAESLDVPYLLIIGQKEAIDNTVTIRNSSTRAQETVSLSLLPSYLKALPF